MGADNKRYWPSQAISRRGALRLGFRSAAAALLAACGRTEPIPAVAPKPAAAPTKLSELGQVMERTNAANPLAVTPADPPTPATKPTEAAKPAPKEKYVSHDSNFPITFEQTPGLWKEYRYSLGNKKDIFDGTFLSDDMTTDTRGQPVEAAFIRFSQTSKAVGPTILSNYRKEGIWTEDKTKIGNGKYDAYVFKKIDKDAGVSSTKLLFFDEKDRGWQIEFGSWMPYVSKYEPSFKGILDSLSITDIASQAEAGTDVPFSSTESYHPFFRAKRPPEWQPLYGNGVFDKNFGSLFGEKGYLFFSEDLSVGAGISPFNPPSPKFELKDFGQMVNSELKTTLGATGASGPATIKDGKPEEIGRPHQAQEFYYSLAGHPFTLRTVLFSEKGFMWRATIRTPAESTTRDVTKFNTMIKSMTFP